MNLTGRRKPLLSLRGITKRFGDLIANDSIDLDLHAGEVLVLLGENGAGKSTLMSILFGHYVADQGAIEVDGKPLASGIPAAALEAGIGMVHQHFTLADNLSVLENVILGTQPLLSAKLRIAEARNKLAVLAGRFGLDIDPDARVADLSVGERQRVEILKALYRDVRILILDEPTAALTPQQAHSLQQTLRKLVAEGLGIIFISHKLDEVLGIGDRILILRGGRLVGEASPKGADRRSLAALMLGRPVEEPARDACGVGQVRVQLNNIRVSDRDGRVRLCDVSLNLHAREIVGVAGISGNGQSQLADVLGGLIVPDSGTYWLDGRNVSVDGASMLIEKGVGRIPEDRHASGVFGDMNIPETLIAEEYLSRKFSRWGFLRWPSIKAFAAEIVSEFSVNCERVDMPARLLSGGNLQKLFLGRVLARQPGFLVVHQPTRGLDVGAAAYVHSRIFETCNAGAAVLVISDDLEEVLKLSDRVAVIFRGQLSTPIPRSEVNLAELGLMMSGHVDTGVSSHAA
ncbi:sugar ABC transporter ATP-binding protein [Mesorhizobium sp. ORS 3428]|nr:sugar ABC transporter ATP-binding protein [Mesorhizobium sp. ORS 3428]